MPLPIIQPRTKIRSSRAGKWRAAVLIGVHLLIAAHITYWLVVGRAVTPVEPSEAAALARSGVINAGFIFFAVTILLTTIFGRFFCGWGCHIVALQDLSRWLLEKVGRRPKPLRSRLLAWVPMIAFLYMFIWPLAYRLWHGPAWTQIGWELTTTEFWATFPGWWIGGLTFFICGFACVYFLGAKGFCTYACPYGAIFGVVDKISPWRIRVTDACQGCGHCTAVCTSNVRVHEEVRDFGMVVDPGCMKCLDCVSVCPNDALYYGFGKPALLASPKSAAKKRKLPLSWSEEAVLAVAFAAGFFTCRGLYGAIPFLMALGLAGILAFAVLLAFQLATRPNIAFKGLRLRVKGELQTAGIAAVGVLAMVLALWTHSAWLRYLGYRADASFQQTADMRRQALDESSQPPTWTSGEYELAGTTLERFERVRQWGLFDTSGAAANSAWMHFLRGDEDRAERLAAAAIALGEKSVEMHQVLARIAWTRGDAMAAAAAYEEAIAAEPRLAEPYVSLGILRASAGDLAAADEVFQRGLQEVPRSVDLVYNAGLVRALRGLSEEAITYFERALALDPRHLPARENLAGVLASIGRLEESVGHYRQAVQQAPDDAETRLLLGRVLIMLGQRAEARQELEEALRLSPGLSEAIMLLQDLVSGR